MEDENSFPISYWHQKFGINISIKYDVAGARFKLEVDKTVFELLPYWVPNQGDNDFREVFIATIRLNGSKNKLYSQDKGAN